MRESKSPEEVAVFNERSFKTLLRAITLSQGQFALILVRCNYVGLQEQLWHRLQALCSVSLQELVLPQSVKTLFSTIKNSDRHITAFCFNDLRSGVGDIH